PLLFQYKHAITRHDYLHFAPGVLLFAAIMTLLMVANEGHLERTVTRRFVAVSLAISLVANWGLEALLALLALAVMFALWRLVEPVWWGETLGARTARGVAVVSVLAGFSVALSVFGTAPIARYPKAAKMLRGPKHLVALFDLKRWRETARAHESR